MGVVVRFPQEVRTAAADRLPEGPCTILILPAIRIERETEESVKRSFRRLRRAIAPTLSKPEKAEEMLKA